MNKSYLAPELLPPNGALPLGRKNPRTRTGLTIVLLLALFLLSLGGGYYFAGHQATLQSVHANNDQA